MEILFNSVMVFVFNLDIYEHLFIFLLDIISGRGYGGV